MSLFASNVVAASNFALLPAQPQSALDASPPVAAPANFEPPGSAADSLASLVPLGGLHPATQTPDTALRLNFMAQSAQYAAELRKSLEKLKEVSVKS